MMRRLSRHGFFGLLAWVLCASLYLWTAEGISIKSGDRGNVWHHYEYLVDGFLNGHLHLSRLPAPELLALPDPYDPQTNVRYRLLDASLYRGKYYLYYGPAPAILLMLPWKIVTGHHLPQWAATAFFAIAGLGALALLLGGIRQKYFPTATPSLFFFAIVLAGHVSWLPVILRRPGVWELPIVTAAALFWWSLFFLWKYHETARRATWALAGGLTLAFASGARPTYALTAGFMVLMFAQPVSRLGSLAVHLRRLIPVLVPLTLGASALIAYNYLRFGAVFEFGQHYQVWGVDYRGMSLFSPAHFPTNVFVYFFTLPDISPYFPFFRTAWIENVQSGYLGIEEMPGLLFTMPAIMLGFAAWRHAYRSWRDPAERVLRIVILAATVGGAFTGIFLFCFGGGCSRYITELLAGWSLVTAIGFLALFTAKPVGPLDGVPRLLAIIAITWTLLCVWLASFEFRNFARTTLPKFYPAVAETLNYPSYWIARQSGQTFGPVLLDIRLAETFSPGSTVLLSAGRQSMLSLLILERVSPGLLRLRLAVNDFIVAETPVFDHPAATLQVECHAPWLYPPSAHPYWREFADGVERGERQTLFALAADGTVVAKRSARVFDATRFEPFVHIKAPENSAIAWVEKLTRLGATPRAASPAASAPVAH